MYAGLLTRVCFSRGKTVLKNVNESVCSQRDRGEKVRGRHGELKRERVTQRERELGETRQRMKRKKKRKGREETDRQTDRRGR